MFAGAIVGWFEVLARLEEAASHEFKEENLYPSRFETDMNVTSLQVQLARAKMLLDDCNYFIEKFSDIISWDDPTLTGAALALFWAFCLRFHTDHWGRYGLLDARLFDSSPSHLFMMSVFSSSRCFVSRLSAP